MAGLLIAIALGFLCGSLPFSFWIGRAIFGVDLRKVGSGNPGATNLMRSVNKKAGIAGLLLDALKGGLPAWLLPLWLTPAGAAVGEWALSSGDVGVLVAMAAILGHVFSPFLAFRGGKGVATSLGAFLALAPVPMLITMAVCLPVMALTRYVALGSVMGALIFPALVWAMGGFGLLLRIVAVVLGLLIIWRHRSNIKRLLRGTESKV